MNKYLEQEEQLLVEEQLLLERLWSVVEGRLSEQLLLERLWSVEEAQLLEQQSMVVMRYLKRMA